MYNDTGYAAARIQCADEEGIAFAGSKIQPIRINTDRSGTLVIDSYGLIPEPYALYVDGQRQPGVYLGAAGETRWAWSNATTNSILVWKPRLMVATNSNPAAATLYPGEVQGYLVGKAR